MNRRLRSRCTALSIAAIALLVAAGCGGDDDDTAADGDGGVPTSTVVGTAGAESDDPWADAIREGLDEYNVAEFREDGDTVVFVMAEGATDEDVTRLCTAAAGIDGPVATEVDGTVTPCP